MIQTHHPKLNEPVFVPAPVMKMEDPDDYTGIFLLFSGAVYYPSGGWSDFRGHFPTVDQAIDFLNTDVDIYDREWFQIVNIETREVVMCQ